MAGATGIAERAELFGSVFVLVGHLTTRMDRALLDLGLTTRQWLLLAVLDTRFPGGPPTLSQAAQEYGSSRQNVKAIAEQLAARGWVRIERDPDDRRATRLHLTDAMGAFHEPGLERRGEDFLDAAFAGLPDRVVHDLHEGTRAWLRVLGHGGQAALG